MIKRGLILSFDDAEAAGQVSIRTTENVETVLIAHGETRIPVKLSDIEDALYEIKEFHKVNAIVKQVQENIAKPYYNCDPGFAIETPLPFNAPYVIPLGPSTNIGSTSTGFTTTITNVTNVPPSDAL